MYQARDFIETDDGLVFAVTLNGLEAGRILGCLRYRQSSHGYVKVATAEAEHLLQTRYLHYWYRSPLRDVSLHGVPVSRVKRHLHPRPRLQALLSQPSGDPLIRKLQRLMERMASSGLDLNQMGVTGSLLLGCQGPDSDLDLVCYSQAAFQRARSFVSQGLASGDIDQPDWQATYARRGCSLSFDEYVWHERRKYNKGSFEGTKFDLILAEEGVTESDPLPWKKLGPVVIQARIGDDSGAFSTPARYRLDHPRFNTVLSFTATYSGQAQWGETVEIAGQQELSPTGEIRLIVGSSREAPGEYIKTIAAKENNHA